MNKTLHNDLFFYIAETLPELNFREEKKKPSRDDVHIQAASFDIPLLIG